MSELKIEQIAAEMQRLADIEAIKQLKARHVYVVDHQDWEAWAKEVLAEDVELVSDGGTLNGRDNVVSSVSRSLTGAKTIHRVYNCEMTITGPNTATAAWPMSDIVQMMHNGAPLLIRGWGYYHEKYVRTPQGWRIKRSQLVRQRVDTERGQPAAAKAGE
jgi:hypothetical protein